MKPFEFRPGKGRSADHLKAVVSDYLSAAKLNGLHRFRDLYPGIKELAEKRGVTVWENGASTALKTLGHKRIISGNVVHTSNMNWGYGGNTHVEYVDFTTGAGVYFVWHKPAN